ncbi:MAG: HAD-IB family hydrolase [Treponema sp.]|nr:HAD-IB family hydrolase [Treponema sp.]
MIRIFDVDHTLIKSSSMRHFAREALGRGIARAWDLRGLAGEWIKYKLGRPDFDFVEKAVGILAGAQKDALEKAARAAFERGISRDVYPEAERAIREALDSGERVIFATSSLGIAIRPLEEFFGIEGSLACELEFQGGAATGRLLGPSPFGPKKKAVVKEWMEKNGISPAETCFYSDSYVDIPLLEFCGKAVAVNPDSRLRREAKRRGWEILRFRA